MNEADEQNFQNLLTRIRQEDAERYIAIVLSTLLARVEEGQCLTMEQFDDDNIRTSVVFVVKGPRQATAMIRAMTDIANNPGDTDDSSGDPVDDRS